MTAPCPHCGGEMVSVADSAREFFPTGSRCVNLFGPHRTVPPVRRRVTYRCIDPNGTSFDCFDYPDAQERFWDMVRRTQMSGLFQMVRLGTAHIATITTQQVEISVIHSIVVQAVDA